MSKDTVSIIDLKLELVRRYQEMEFESYDPSSKIGEFRESISGIGTPVIDKVVSGVEVQEATTIYIHRIQAMPGQLFKNRQCPYCYQWNWHREVSGSFGCAAKYYRMCRYCHVIDGHATTCWNRCDTLYKLYIYLTVDAKDVLRSGGWRSYLSHVRRFVWSTICNNWGSCHEYNN